MSRSNPAQTRCPASCHAGGSQGRRMASAEVPAFTAFHDIIKPQFVVAPVKSPAAPPYITSPTSASTRCGRRSTTGFDKPRRWINPAAWARWAWHPYAMGAQLANPDSEVVCTIGEGSIQMNIQELHLPQYNTCRSRLQPEQPLPGHGAPVAGAVTRRPLQPTWIAARFREAGRVLAHCRHHAIDRAGWTSRALARPQATPQCSWTSVTRRKRSPMVQGGGATENVSRIR